MTIEEKAKRYDEAFGIARNVWRFSSNNAEIMRMEELFPELEESEDERIRKALLEMVHDTTGDSLWVDYNVHKEDAIAWLEKQGKHKFIDDLTQQEAMDIAVAKCFEQGEQKPADKVEPKFHEGEWIISNDKKSTYQVIEVKRGIYVIRDNADNHEYHIGIEECEKSGRLFTIQDAKDGDVLQLGVVTVIFQEYIGNGNCKCYYSVCNGEFEIPTKDESYGTFNATPATKEQRDLLFSKMKEVGYEWNSEKKELKKLSQRMISAEVKEEPVNEDLEDYAKKESESFAEREYEIDYIDRNALAKGYYWGVKAGAEWLAGQGETLYDTINVDGKNQRWLGENLLYGDYDAGQAVIVQIRKI